jgi:predicted site-specific integrase-resolvase
MKLSEYAKIKEVSYTTAYKWFKNGDIPNATQMPSGAIQIQIQEKKKDYVILYCFIAQEEPISSLETQLTTEIEFCKDNQLEMHKSVKEISTYDDRPKLLEILNDPNVTMLIVTNRKRLPTKAIDYIELLCKEKEIELVFTNRIWRK